MRRVVVESPYSAPTPEGIERHVEYARACLRDCIRRGEAPIASHLLLTQPGVLDDADPLERETGMRAGWAWIDQADAVVVYEDLGVSSGMRGGMATALTRGVRVELRRLGGKWATLGVGL